MKILHTSLITLLTAIALLMAGCASNGDSMQDAEARKQERIEQQKANAAKADADLRRSSQ